MKDVLADIKIKPYRVALVIGDQWDDPAGFLVNVPSTLPEDQYSDSFVSRDFSSLIIMFKSWGIPFDIIRLDQEFMDINRFIGPDGKPNVGCIVWDVDDRSELQPQRYEVLREAVNDYGISLIALADRIKEPVIQELLGIKYNGDFLSSDSLELSGVHFIIKGLKSPFDYTNESATACKSVEVGLNGAESIVERGKYPQVTVHRLESGAGAVWIGGDIERMFSRQEIRTLFRRAITWCIGYSLFKTWENKGWMMLDDPGGAQNPWLDHWHYPTLTEEQIDERLIKPLKEHNAILVINVIPGFVNDELKRVEPSFKRTFTDEFGTFQDYPSTLRGLIKGMEAGVFEISSHGLTHMQPDLWSKPGPWFGAALDKERAEVGWYREFGDVRRGREIPAAETLWRMKTGIKWLEYLFGITPLSFSQGGEGPSISISYPNHTYRLTALAGFGWYTWSGGYLGRDLAVRGWDFRGTMDCPLFAAAPPDAHDKGIAEHPEQFLRVFKENPDVEWMGLREYIAYIHADVSGGGDNGFALKVVYDSHYCRHFEKNNSEWNFLAADWLGKALGNVTISVDGQTTVKSIDLNEQLKIKIPAGLGTHNIQIK